MRIYKPKPAYRLRISPIFPRDLRPIDRGRLKVNKEGIPLDAMGRPLPIAESRDDQIIQLREYGYTLQSIGDLYGLTRERIRQITKRQTYQED